MEIQDIVTLSFAWLSVLFAGLSFWYSKLAYSRDNARIKCSIKRMQLFTGNDSTDVMAIKIINAWRRSIKLENITFDFSKNNWWLIIPNHSTLILPQTHRPPYTINESDYFFMCIEYKSFVEKLKLESPWKYIKSFKGFDSVWNIYCVELSYSDFPEICKNTIIGKIKSFLKL